MKRKPEATTEPSDGAIQILTPVKAIRAHCLHCCGYSPKEVRLCTVESCSLYPYRMGHCPGRKRKGAEKEPQESKNQASECGETPEESPETA